MSLGARCRPFHLARGAAVALAFGLAPFVACTSDDDGPRGDPADCTLIANRCHPYDSESELARECHDTGHDGSSPERCSELRATCLDACPPHDSDAGSGGGDAGTDSGASGGSSSGAGGEAGGAAGSEGGAPGGSTSGGGPSNGGAPSGGASNGGANAGMSNGGTSMAGTAAGGTAGTAGAAGTAPDGGETACETLGRVCHGMGPGFTEECHEIGHDGDEPACQAAFAECLAACQDGGA